MGNAHEIEIKLSKRFDASTLGCEVIRGSYTVLV